MHKSFIFFLLLGGAMLSSAAPVTLTTGSNVTLDFNGFYDSSVIVIPGLSGQVNLSAFVFSDTTVDGNAATRVTFNYMVTNDSTAPVMTSRITNFAFNTTPNVLVTSLNQVTGVFDTIEINANQPNGVGTVEICFTDQNCPGGGSNGVSKGTSGGGTATLHFAGAGRTSFILDNAFLRYQSVSCQTGSPCSGSASGSLDPGGNVPEPSTYTMLLAGIAAIAVSRYRRAA